MRQTARRIRSAIHEIEHLGGEATDERVAQAIGVTVERYRGGMSSLVNVGIDEFDETNTVDITSTSLEDQLARRHLVELVRAALTNLRVRDVAILGMYYIDEQTFAEIGTSIGITPSRVCQLLHRAVELLRTHLGEHGDRMAA